MPIFPTLRSFYEDYEMPLARALFYVSQHGFLVDPDRLSDYKKNLDREAEDCLTKASVACNKLVIGAKKDIKNAVKINSPKDVLKVIKELGLEIPKTRVGNTWKENSTGAATLQRIYSKSGCDFVYQVIRYREIQRMRSTYAEAKLLDNVLYSSYRPTGTIGGRRSSTENHLGLGTNGQNLPKHSRLGMLYRKCIISRPGKIFIFCDQKSAEDWIVHGIIADASAGKITSGIDELLSGINRHKKLAAFIFGKPESEVGKDTIFYYLGKRVRHAGHYGMQGNRMSTSLAEKGIHIPDNICQHYINKFHELEPQIQRVFQKYVEEELRTKRALTTPFGRRRDFLGLRSFSDNSKIFRDAYSYIPQSSIGDNNGCALLKVEEQRAGIVVSDQHDALGVEVDAELSVITKTILIMEEAFNRIIRFPNGFEIKIPVEFEMGFSLGEMETCDDLTKVGLQNTLNTLLQRQNPLEGSISGQPQPSLQQA